MKRKVVKVASVSLALSQLVSFSASLAGTNEIIDGVDNNDKLSTENNKADLSSFETKWIYGVEGPKIEDFHWQVDGKNGYYVAADNVGTNIFDANKKFTSDSGDYNLCSAGVASNMFHWWLSMNKENIDRYFSLNEDNGVVKFPESGKPEWLKDKNSFSLREEIEYDSTNHESKIFKLLSGYFSNRAVWVHKTLDYLITGYRGVANIEKNNQYTEISEKTIDKKGGFFKGVFDRKILSDYNQIKSYADFGNMVRNAIEQKKAMGVSYEVINCSSCQNGVSRSHVINIWGADFKPGTNEIQAIYVTDTDDNTLKFGENNDKLQTIKRYRIIEHNNLPYICNVYDNSTFGVKTVHLYTLDLGEKVWEEYFAKPDIAKKLKEIEGLKEENPHNEGKSNEDSGEKSDNQNSEKNIPKEEKEIDKNKGNNSKKKEELKPENSNPAEKVLEIPEKNAEQNNLGAGGGSGSEDELEKEKPETEKKEMKNVERISGKSRIETAIGVSKEIFKKGTQNVIIANKDKYTDTLTAVPLASKLQASMLFVDHNNITDSTLNEIKRLGAKNIYIIGGKASVSDNIEQKMKNFNIVRFSGKNKYETSRKIAKFVAGNSKIDSVEIASGENFADALAISGISVKKKTPIILSDEKKVGTDTENLLKDFGVKKVNIAGGTSSISKNTEKRIQKEGINVKRFSGANRYETSQIIAREVGLSEQVIISNGNSSADSLIAGFYSSAKKSPLLLVQKDNLSKGTLETVNNIKAKKVIAIGGEKMLGNRILEEFNKFFEKM